MVEYRRAKKEEAVELLDFINLVFSQNSRPHDFKKMFPHMYNDTYPYWNDHLVAVEDGKILGTVAICDKFYDVADMKLKCGRIEQVSVHLYHRGRGFMKTLMNMAVEDMKKSGCDYSSLGGQRQRYEYFGYSQGNSRWFFSVNATNIRHKMQGREPLLTYKDGELYNSDGIKVGVIDNYGYTLDDLSLTVDALAAFFKATGNGSVNYSTPPHDIGRIAELSRIAENTSYGYYGMVQIFNFRRCLEAGLRLRANAGLCENGEVTIKVGDEIFGIRVCDGKAETFDCDTYECEFEPYELQELALSQCAYIVSGESRIPRGWFPITLT